MQTNLDKTECPVGRAVDVIGDWWSLLIVRDVFDGITRFSAIQRSLGIARGILTSRLRGLVEADVLSLKPAADGTTYQEYALTGKGRDLFPVIVALRQWGEAHLYGPGEKHSVLIESETGKPVSRLELRSRAGKALQWKETRVRKLSTDAKPVPARRR